MKVRALDALDDWSFGRGAQCYLKDADALAQSVKTRLRQWLNNCFFAMDEGVDWANELDIGTKDALDRDIKRSILQTAGVLRISEYTSTLDSTTRALSIEAHIDTKYGDIAITEAL
jgi:hypothetical protein